jgi:hypothetical protein
LLLGGYLWYMGTKLIITESQYKTLKQHINESGVLASLVEKLVRDLNTNYEPMIGIVREDEEYYEKPMIKIKIDESETTPRKLFEYFKKKYKLGDKFIQQVIGDWMFGKIKDNKLSRNVPIN